MIIGWTVPQAERERLLQLVPASFKNVHVDKIIWEENAPENTPPMKERMGNFIGFTDDEGIQALVVRLDGSTDRPDGEILHMIWSLDDGYTSNDVLDIFQEEGFSKLAPISFKMIPWNG